VPDLKARQLEVSLQDYKQKVPTPLAGTLRWERDLVFTGETPTGYELELDAARQWGCQPMEALLLSLAGCMAIDVLSILKKMRIEVSAFRVAVHGERNAVPPQYLRSVRLVIQAAGSGLEARHLERAVALSQEKYCSVYHSLRPDLQVSVDYQIVQD